jgi:hypothetical protein
MYISNNLGILIIVALFSFSLALSIYITVANYSLNSILSFWIISTILLILFLGMIIMRYKSKS